MAVKDKFAEACALARTDPEPPKPAAPEFEIIPREEAYDVVRQERRRVKHARKEVLKATAEANPNGGIARDARALLREHEALERFIADSGGVQDVMRWLSIEVARGVALTELAKKASVDYGVLWLWLSDDPERLGRYDLARRGQADAFMSEVVPIADGKLKAPGVYSDGARKWRGQARLAVAAKLDRDRFGDRDGPLVNFDMRDRVKPEDLMAQLAAMEAANPMLRKLREANTETNAETNPPAESGISEKCISEKEPA